MLLAQLGGFGIGTARALDTCRCLRRRGILDRVGGQPPAGRPLPPSALPHPPCPIAVTVSVYTKTAPAPSSPTPCPCYCSIRAGVSLPLPVGAGTAALLLTRRRVPRRLRLGPSPNAGSAETPRPHSANPTHATPGVPRLALPQNAAAERPPCGWPCGASRIRLVQPKSPVLFAPPPFENSFCFIPFHRRTK